MPTPICCNDPRLSGTLHLAVDSCAGCQPTGAMSPHGCEERPVAGRVATWAAATLCFFGVGAGGIVFSGSPAHAQQTDTDAQSVQAAEIWYGNRRVDGASVEDRVQPVDGSEPDERAIRDMLVQARHLARHGDIDDALGLIRLAANYPIQWDDEEELTPESLLRELKSLPRYRSTRGSSLPGLRVLEFDSPRPLRPTGADTPDEEPEALKRSAGQENAERPPTIDEEPPEAVPAIRSEDTSPLADGEPASLSAPGAASALPTDSAIASAGIVARSEPAGILHPLEAGNCQPASYNAAVAQPTAPQVVLATIGADGVAGQQSLSHSQTFSLVGFVGGLLLCPVVVTLVAFFALGRVASGKGFALRVHVVNDPKPERAGAVSTPQPQPHGATSNSSGGGTVVDLQTLDVPLALDTGAGTFDEKRQKEEEEAQTKRQALVKQLFEHNLSLRQELHDLEPAVA